MNKKILLVTLTLIMLAVTANAFTIAATYPTENSVFCQARGSTIDLNISDQADLTGAADGNLFAIYVTSQADGNFGIADNGGGNIHPDFNAFYADSDGNMQVRLTVPTVALASNFTTGNLTITVKDLNGGSMVATTTLNVKPTWTQTTWTTNPLICAMSSYTSVSQFTITNTSGYGSIQFLDTVDISSDIDFDAATTEFSKRKLNFYSSVFANERARITFSDSGIKTGAVEIIKDGSGCSKCNLISLSNGDVVFDTTGFSTYEVKEAPIDGDLPPGVFAATGTSGLQLPDVSALDNNTKLLILGIVVVVAFLVLNKK